MDEIIKTESLTNTVGEIKSIIVEAEYNSRWDLIAGYHQAGTLINSLEGNKEKLVQYIAGEIDRSERTLWNAVMFAKTYPDINKLPEGKNISWTKIVNKYLTEAKTEETKGLKLQRGSVVFMNAGTIEGYGNAQCVSEVVEELSEIGLFGHNQHYKTYDVKEIIENL